MGAPSPGDTGQAAEPPLTAYQRFWKRPDVIGTIVLVGAAIQIALLLVPSREPPPEIVQRLKVADDTYLLGFHRKGGGYNTVMRNGLRIFDSRQQGAGLCLRLFATPQGGVEAECYDDKMGTTRRYAVTHPATE
ncbi:hypothetical protein [Arenimonas metalli]|uniref:Uncharacterized protein n=1 Tax=Arenimonas metalli CF5-1 TaxID=1384056 RepID=A0A091ASM4_9GAMM|nr:hypothetical protein [Arenimonas metalli]KFN41964.1 hypothetical protein N787_04150 [Arenimonas metalli CF5-1]